MHEQTLDILSLMFWNHGLESLKYCFSLKLKYFMYFLANQVIKFKSVESLPIHYWLWIQVWVDPQLISGLSSSFKTLLRTKQIMLDWVRITQSLILLRKRLLKISIMPWEPYTKVNVSKNMLLRNKLTTTCKQNKFSSIPWR